VSIALTAASALCLLASGFQYRVIAHYPWSKQFNVLAAVEWTPVIAQIPLTVTSVMIVVCAFLGFSSERSEGLDQRSTALRLGTRQHGTNGR
jgi:hypothetical protein